MDWDFGFFIRLVVITVIVIIGCFLGIDYYKNNYYDKDMIHTYTRTQTVQAIKYTGENIQEVIELVGINNISYQYGTLKIEDIEYGSIEVPRDYYIVKEKEDSFYIYPEKEFMDIFKFIK